MAGENITATQGGPSPLVNRALALLMSKATPAEIQEMMREGVVAKAEGSGNGSPGMNGDAPYINDQWDNGRMDRVPDLMIGRTDAATGGDAKAMNDAYSSHVTQRGITEAAQELGRRIDKIHSMMKAMGQTVAGLSNENAFLKSALHNILGHIDTLTKASTAGTAVAVKAKKEGDEEEDEEKKKKDMPYGKSNTIADHIDAMLAKANASFASAAALTTESRLVAASTARSEGIKHLERAVSLAKAMEDSAASVTAIGVIQEMAKAHDKECTNQTIWPDSKKEEAEGGKHVDGVTMKADTSVATEGLDPRVADFIAKASADMESTSAAAKQAIEGMRMTQLSLSQFMHTVAGASKNPANLPPITELSKGGTINETVILAKAQRIQSAVESGNLNSREADQARDLLGIQRSMANDPGIDPTIFRGRLDKATPAVKALFADAA